MLEHRKSKFDLHITPHLRQKLDDAMILETEVEAVIEHCESTGKKVFDPDSATFSGHLQIGNITYWVEYSLADNEINLINAYCHRMSIEEA